MNIASSTFSSMSHERSAVGGAEFVGVVLQGTAQGFYRFSCLGLAEAERWQASHGTLRQRRKHQGFAWSHFSICFAMSSAANCHPRASSYAVFLLVNSIGSSVPCVTLTRR